MATATPLVRAHVVLGHISHSAAAIARIQAGASAGASADTLYLNPLLVVRHDLPAYGFTAPIDIVPRGEAVVSYLGRQYRVPIVQPARHGPGGIWLTAGVLPVLLPRARAATPQPTVPGLLIGTSTHSAGIIRTIQSGADAHRPAYAYYLNPAEVIWKNLPLYGFKATVRITRLTLTVRFQRRRYDIVLRQPRVVGPGGVWMIDTIRTP